jgi:hypothetical protein
VISCEDVERIGVAEVNVRAGYPFARRVAGVGDCQLVASDENADLAILLVKDCLPAADYGAAARAFALRKAAAAAGFGLSSRHRGRSRRRAPRWCLAGSIPAPSRSLP